MIDFLKDYGISDNVFQEILNVNVSTNIYNLSCNKEEVVKIMEFFKNIGINDIGQLLIYKIDLFFMTFDDVMKMFDGQDINLLVQNINEDYSYIDELL